MLNQNNEELDSMENNGIFDTGEGGGVRVGVQNKKNSHSYVFHFNLKWSSSKLLPTDLYV